MIEVIIVEYTSVNNTDRSQSAINVRIEGPVGDIISLVLAIPVFIIGVVMLAILFLSLITDYKTKDYIKAEAEKHLTPKYSRKIKFIWFFFLY